MLGAVQRRQAFLTRGISPDFPPSIAHDGPQLGINVYLAGADAAAIDDAFGRIAALGITHVKQSFYFTPAFDWDSAERLLTAASRHGLTLVPLLDGDPATNFAPPADVNTFAEWAGQFASRFGDQITAYIIWDEPNLASHWGDQLVNADAYAALLSAAAATIRAVDSDAQIVAAPLAPTSETDSVNLADPLYLQLLYESGADFDIAAAKPYGFDTGPDDRRAALNVLNFSRAILLREVMVRNGDGDKPLWAGNWGWNALPPDWAHAPSIWGSTDSATQGLWTTSALDRAQREWPWLGMMFLESWQPAAPTDDPLWGFSIRDKPVADSVAVWQAARAERAVAWPGFHAPAQNGAGQTWRGDWEIVPGFGADSSEKSGTQPRDTVTLTFWGSDVGVWVRRADFRARFYATVDGQPANARPRDENGATIVLDAPDRSADYVALEPVARNLPPGQHTLTLTAERGWDQFALQGFVVAYHPPDRGVTVAIWGLRLAALAFLVLAWRTFDLSAWGRTGGRWHARYRQLTDRVQLALVSGVALVGAVAGWLTWGQQAAGAYRRLGDFPQIAATAAVASLFYVAPSAWLYGSALLCLLLLLALRPAWGVALVALTLPVYTEDVLKPVYAYRFSPVEVFTLTALAALLLNRGWRYVVEVRRIRPKTLPRPTINWQPTDWGVLIFVLIATASLFFTERLDVATNDWRTVIIEPALFYVLWRGTRLSQREMWTAVDAFVLAGVVVALIGLVAFGFGLDRVTAEAGLPRLRSFYGSPNNVALIFGRILPIPLAVVALGAATRRRWLYGLALLPMLAAFGLTFSKGGLLLGLPAALLVITAFWLAQHGRRVWPWLAGLTAAGALLFLAVRQLPALSARLDLFGVTTVLRIDLWRASWQMFIDNFWTGVGLDNFLTQYRGRYIFADAWREPDLSHPHNLWLDLGTRLGIFGIISGTWLLLNWARLAWTQRPALPQSLRPLAAAALAALAALVVHGMVDHSLFLVDLAYAFYFWLGLLMWLQSQRLPQ